ncbi:MAG: hypothetical protein JOZ00_03610 [Mycobacterium sp.]|uniref:hypothetical protein n=1 Tax=Mycobacterium sp. TaxID=1785 RepID=UPI001ED616E3|nr:hypothetical protein [Mycobacterium sp.]MBV8785754.1 hypothetical protein [Mycobacterium sp.]
MSNLVAATGAAGAVIAAALGLPAIAAANPDSADVVVSNLEAQGYNVQYLPAVPRSLLSQCSVNATHPSNLDQSASLQEKQHTLVQVDVACPSN